MLKEPDPSVIGQDGAIENFMGDIQAAAAFSNGYVLELGCGKGTGSTLAIQRGLAQIDPFRYPAQTRPLHISVDISDRLEWKPSVIWWGFIKGDTREPETLAEVMAVTARRPGLIFIDTEHNYEQMKTELELWSSIAARDTVWLFHDTFMFGRRNPMVDAIEEFAKANGWHYDNFRTEQHGLGKMTRD